MQAAETDLSTETPLKILIQDKRSGFFLSEQGAWEEDSSIARDFPNTTKASQFCEQEGLREVHITLKFFNGIPDIHLPLH